MSLLAERWFTSPERFPRVSGDEPATQIRINGALVFSPRERG